MQVLLLTERARSDFAALSFEIFRLEAARKQLGLPVPPEWSATLSRVQHAVALLHYWSPDDASMLAEMDGSYIPVADSLTDGIAMVGEMGFAEARAVLLDAQALAEAHPPSGEQREDLEKVEAWAEPLRTDMAALTARWQAARPGPEQVADWLAVALPVEYRPGGHVDAYWLHQIQKTEEYARMWDDLSRRLKLDSWKPPASVLRQLEQEGLRLGGKIWTGDGADQLRPIFVVSNRGLLQCQPQQGSRDTVWTTWPEGEDIAYATGPENIRTVGSMDVPFRLELRALQDRLAAARSRVRFPIATDTWMMLRHSRDMLRFDYLIATLGVSNRALFMPLFNLAVGLGVLGFILLGTSYLERWPRVLAGDATLRVILLQLAVTLAIYWVLSDAVGSARRFAALMRGTITRGRGQQPIHDSFGTKSVDLGQQNLVLRLMRFKPRD